MDREHVIRRLRYLRNWEFANILLMPIFTCMILVAYRGKGWQSYVLSVWIVSYILAQGTFYWHLKLQGVEKRRSALPPYFHRLFTFFRKSNITLLALFLILALGGWLLPGLHFHVTILSAALFGLGALELVNYYYYQLSHDNMNDIRYLLKYRKLRRSPLSVDLRKTGRAEG